MNTSSDASNLSRGESVGKPDKGDYNRVVERLKFLSERAIRLQNRLESPPALPKAFRGDFAVAIGRSVDEEGELLGRKWDLLKNTACRVFIKDRKCTLIFFDEYSILQKQCLVGAFIWGGFISCATIGVFIRWWFHFMCKLLRAFE